MQVRISILLALAWLLSPGPAQAQTEADTLPERVVAHIYDAINHCDRAAWYSWFAPVWYHSDMEDSAEPATRRTCVVRRRAAGRSRWSG